MALLSLERLAKVNLSLVVIGCLILGALLGIYLTQKPELEPSHWVEDPRMTLNYPDTMSVFIEGGSMKPCINDGGTVVSSKNFEIDNLQEGDILQFKSKDEFVVHRIIEIHKDESGDTYFITQGDNNNYKDSKRIYKEDINSVIIGVIY